MHYFLRLFIISSLFTLLSFHSTYAVDNWVWRSTAPDNSWTNINNWTKNGGTPPAGSQPTTGDNVTIQRASGSITIAVPASRAFTSLTTGNVQLNLSGNNTISGALIIGSGTTLSSGTITVTTSTACSITASTIGTTISFNTSADVTISSASAFTTPLSITSTSTITISNSTFSASASVTLNSSAAALVSINSPGSPTTTFNGTFTANLNFFNIDHCVFNGTTIITKPAGSNTPMANNYNHDNIYNGSTTITNASSTSFFFGNNDTFNGSVIFNRDNQFDFYIGSSVTYPLLYFKGNVTFNNNNTSNPTGVMSIAANAGNVVEFDPTGNNAVNVLFNNASNNNINIGSVGSVDFKSRVGSLNTIAIELRNSHTLGAGHLAFGDGAGIVHFGSRVSTFTLTSFSIGTITLSNSTFDNNTTLYLSTGLAARTTLRLKPGVVVNNGLTVQFKNIEITGGTYKSGTSTMAFTKFGASPTDANCSDNIATGIVTFDGSVTFTNASANKFNFGAGGAASSDRFYYNGTVTLYKNIAATGCDIKTSTGGISYFGGDFNYYGYSVLAPTLGKTIFNGSTDQHIWTNVPASVSNNIWLGFLQVNKSGGKLYLDCNVTMGGVLGVPGLNSDLTLTSGNILTTASNLLIVQDEATTSGGGLNSFVEGPLKKEGNNIFIFHVGKPSIYMPLAITAPSANNMALTAEFINSAAPGLTTTQIISPLRDFQRCQYWTLTNSNVAAGTPAVKVTLSWNNTAGQTCYPVNANTNVVSIAYYNSASTPQWENVASALDVASLIPGVSTVTSSANVSTFGSFSLGYKNALVIDTRLVNKTTFSVANNIEPLTLTSFTSGTTVPISTQDFTGLGYMNNSPGILVLHPTPGTTVDLAIQTDTRTDALNLKIFMEASTATLPAVNKVQGQEDGVYNDMSTELYSRNANFVTFYKDRQDPAYYTSLTNNLTDGITFYASRYSPNLATSFQITGVPAGFTPTLTIAPITAGITGSVIVTTSTLPLTWDGKISNVYVAEGIYEYNLQLVNTPLSQTYTYRGQFSLKYK